jgi:hypothetical protein
VDYVIQSTDTRYTLNDRDGDHYFKIEPIAWRVLENASGKLFLLADKSIDLKRYNENATDNMTWAESTARSWLNGYPASDNTDGEDYSAEGSNFIGNAFTPEEQTKIANTDVDNPVNPNFTEIPGGDNTTDKIFFLKVADVNNASYGFTDNNSRKAAPTSYAIALGAYVNSGNAHWWLRSPGGTTSSAARVAYDGTVVSTSVISNVAVRPAFYLQNLSNLIFKSAAGGGYNTYLNSGLKTLTAAGTDASALSPSFNTDTTEYNVTVPYSTTSITLGATADSLNETSAKITIDGTGAQSLNVGSNEFLIQLNTPGGNILKTYTVTVTRAVASTNATLGSLGVSAGTLSPIFTSSTEDYTVSVPYDTDSITLTATKSDTNATVTGDYGEQDLEVGENEFEITVTAQDGTTKKTYTVTVTRAASANANLSNLTVNPGTLSPTFTSSTEDYTVSVPYSTDSITLTATKSDTNATVTGDGVKQLDIGDNEFEITVTAQDGTTKKTYTLNVTRAAGANAKLNALTVSAGTLEPHFNYAVTNYNVSVPNATTKITLGATVDDPNSTIANGTLGEKSLNVGANKFTIKVTAENGTTEETYTVNVTRAASANANLKMLTVSAGTLSPAFSSGTESYTVEVPYVTDSITLTATEADTNATIANGALGEKSLSVGANKFTITVTAEDGTTEKIYTVTVNRKDLVSVITEPDDDPDDDSGDDSDNDNDVATDIPKTGDDITALWLINLIASAALISLFMALLIHRKAVKFH